MPWVIAVTHGEAQTGLLGACTTLAGLSSMFLQGLGNFLGPRAAQAYSRGGLTELRSVLVKAAVLFVATLGSLAVAAFLFGEQLAVLVYGPHFAGAGPIIGLLSLSVLANSVGVVAGNGLWAIERPSANFVADSVSVGITIVAMAICVPLWGPLGAAAATLAGTASDAAVRPWILRLAMQELAAEEPSNDQARDQGRRSEFGDQLAAVGDGGSFLVWRFLRRVTICFCRGQSFIRRLRTRWRSRRRAARPCGGWGFLAWAAGEWSCWRLASGG